LTGGGLLIDNKFVERMFGKNVNKQTLFKEQGMIEMSPHRKASVFDPPSPGRRPGPGE
jgi:hypothetical protein